ncbi:hypothetical protein [Methylobacterium oxalidis]|uniref:Uncharacterized protein n=1 Tax=Methylobacterium oxalidis TaxID=944322 RepID=A0A512J4F5_9HYPH|nr:hypothetical protein [Methylobacterium oxalidis]GEP04729.1 hypothetical protein MOX02_27670 [Methylobacterium oxalidis]GJE32801.1 hypothetical protein LDDCCGHA_2990 [Methylobacterium oxalidis]GLS63216.1 hypothetical protein GCM10007888_15970 [Methylobacterium oxalidis]
MQELFKFDVTEVAPLKRAVTDLVVSALGDAGRPKAELIAELRQLESRARAFGAEAHIVQVLVSGRRLLGDREDLPTPQVRGRG